jgi:hypothetical protein
MAIQIGKYKRPGIFIEEIDKSVFSTPTVEGITNLVIGVSKKGPVNTPIRLTTVNDLEAVYGQLDRNLERKGSFFHRTVSKMLESSPVFAMNVLLTDDTLDVIEYKSLSSSARYLNDIKREGPYRRFFDTTGFWKRDTEAFINLTKNNSGYAERALSFTNLSDRYVTVFAVKTQVSGFDRTLLEWYGSIEKLPPYVNASDYASDYMVDVVVIAGDWSDYRNLAVDNRWGQYFNSDGLIKGQLRNFANDRNVTLLAYYEGLSLIPYFRDLEGRNIFIETTINRGTDTTGLYCAFNADLVEEDYYTGLVDLIGGTLIDSANPLITQQKEIDFLSYKETIIESVPFTATPLDLPGNVVALFGTVSNNNSGLQGQMPHAFGDPKESGIVVHHANRTAWFTEGAVCGVNLATGTDVDTDGHFNHTKTGSGTASILNVKYTSTNFIDNGFDVSPYAVIGGQYVPVTYGTYSFNVKSVDFTYSETVATYSTVFTLNTSGVISSVTSYTPNVRPSVSTSDIVLGYISYNVINGGFSGTASFQEITIASDPTLEEYVIPGYGDDVYFQAGTTPYQDLTYGTNSTVHDYYIYDLSNTVGYSQGDVRLVFWGTAGSDVKNYVQFRKLKMFNKITEFLGTYKDQATMIISVDGSGKEVKKSLASMTVTEVVTSSTQNKSLVLKTGLSNVSYISGANGGVFKIYKNDNEFILGEDKLRTKDEPANTNIGVVGKYSTFYQKYFNGLINDGDYFYANRLLTTADKDTLNEDFVDGGGNLTTTINVTFVNGEATPDPTVINTLSDYAGYNYVVFETPSVSASTAVSSLDLQLLDQILFPVSLNNTTSLTIQQNSVNFAQGAVALATALGFTGSNFFAYEVAENVTYEQLTGVTLMYNTLESAAMKSYLQMFVDLDGLLEVSFTSDDLISINSIEPVANYTFNVQSELSNLKQTLEIELPTGYTQVPNKILVNASRYSEVKVGDFLLADNSDFTPALGQTNLRNLTRILSKRQYAGDTSLTEITCDAKILKTSYTNPLTGLLDYQTTRYSTVDQYTTTYKGISLKGFRVRQASLPDGTETKQNQILNLVAKGTPLFKALINKEAFDFRYLVDSFGLGLVERSKQQLVDICGERLNVFGFINMPSLKSFKNSSSPSFVNTEGVLQVEFIAKGGDPESNPAFLYSFGDGNGVSTVGYFTPYVTVNDNGRPLDFPPASYVATTYMRKHTSIVSNITPWTIAAGVTNGRVTNIAGVEHDFNPTDIEFLNQAQMNPIVLKRNRGYVIETENTALTIYKSALSLIHVREVLVELERELAAMLLDYQWKFNTPDVRAEIKLRADVICETYVNKNGLYNYFNKMDDENNTVDIIDSQIGVLDTYVEPIKGMGIIVNNVTILRTGAIAAGGFINA